MMPNAALNTGDGARASSPTVVIPSDRMRVASFGPTPHIDSHFERPERVAKAFLIESREPARLVHSGGHLRYQLVRPDTDRSAEMEALVDLGLDRARRRDRRLHA